MTTLKLVVLAKNQVELRDFQLEHVLGVADELVLIANDSGRFGGLGAIGNQARWSSRCDVVGIVHADTRLGPGTVASLRDTAATGALAGIVGIDLGGKHIWGRDVQGPTRVSTLDSCAVFIPALLGVTFDEVTFDSFHCCVEDLCLQAPGRVLVAPGPADHLGTNWGKPDWMKEYWSYREKLARKWAGVEFRTT